MNSMQPNTDSLARYFMALCLFCTAFYGAADEKQYTGDWVAVLDAIGQDWADSRLGVDPILASQLRRNHINLKVTAPWEKTLRAELELEDLDLVHLEPNGWLVTRLGQVEFLGAVAHLRAGEMDAAIEDLRVGLERAPDDFAATSIRRSVLRFAERAAKLTEEAAALDSCLDKIEKKEADAEAEFDELFARYVDAWERAMGTLWRDHLEVRALGLESELSYVVPVARKHLDELVDRLNRVRALYPKVVAEDEIVAKRDMEREFHDIETFVSGQIEKAALLTAKGRRQWESGHMDTAVQLLGQAVDGDSSNLDARAVLAWVQSALRAQGMNRADATASAPPDATLGKRISALARTLAKNAAADELAVLHRLAAEHKVTLPELSPAAGKTAIGRVNGLATAGGEFSQGSVFPLSVTVGPRRQNKTRHELAVNDGAVGIGDDLYASVVDALSWLEHRVGGILRHYRVTVHFDDLESHKGGSSFGLALAAAGFSALYEYPLPESVVFTGAVAADGRVQAVSGLWPKLAAAVTAGKQLAFVPRENEADISLLPDSIINRIRIVFVSTVDDCVAQLVTEEQDERLRLAKDASIAGDLYRQLGLFAEAKVAYELALRSASSDHRAQHYAEALSETTPAATEALAWLQDGAATKASGMGERRRNIARMITGLAAEKAAELNVPEGTEP